MFCYSCYKLLYKLQIFTNLQITNISHITNKFLECINISFVLINQQKKYLNENNANIK